MRSSYQALVYKLGWILLLTSGCGFVAAASNGQAAQPSSPERAHLGMRFFPVENSDIGSPLVRGTTREAGNSLEITAGGKDIWGTSDEFHFSYRQQTGDFDVMVRVVSFCAPHLYTKAGLMARESLSPNSRHIFFLVFPDNRPRHLNTSGYEFQYRDKPRSESNAIYPPQAEGSPAFPVEFPHAWLRLRREHNEFTGFVSADGETWKVYGTHSLDLPRTIFLGLAVTSHVPDKSTAAKFTDFGKVEEIRK